MWANSKTNKRKWSQKTWKVFNFQLQVETTWIDFHSELLNEWKLNDKLNQSNQNNQQEFQIFPDFQDQEQKQLEPDLGDDKLVDQHLCQFRFK